MVLQYGAHDPPRCPERICQPHRLHQRPAQGDAGQGYEGRSFLQAAQLVVLWSRILIFCIAMGHGIFIVVMISMTHTLFTRAIGTVSEESVRLL